MHARSLSFCLFAWDDGSRGLVRRLLGPQKERKRLRYADIMRFTDPLRLLTIVQQSVPENETSIRVRVRVQSDYQVQTEMKSGCFSRS